MFDIYTYDPNQNSLFPAAIGLVGAIIGGLLSFLGTYLVYKGQIKNEIKNVAKAIELDIKTVEKADSFSTAYYLFTNDPSSVLGQGFEDSKLIPNIPPYPFYNKETGLYSIYKRDISKLNPDLAIKIYNFYDNLIVAENYREFICQKRDFLSQEDNERIIKYNEMTKMIKKCGNNISEIRTDLEKIYKT